MASNKKKLTPLQQQYNREFKNYRRRIREAEKLGYQIPEKYIKIKKDKPRTRDIEALKKITRNTFQEEIKKGKAFFADPYTGEIIENVKPQKYVSPFAPNVEQPTTFSERLYVADYIKDYYKRYHTPESMKEHGLEFRIREAMSEIRGPDFNWGGFVEVEKKQGKLFADPNRPLDQDEINTIQDYYDKGYETAEEQNRTFTPAKTIPTIIEELRSWNPAFNYYDKFLPNELEKTGDNVFSKVDEHIKAQQPQYKQEEYDGGFERPTTSPSRGYNVAETPMETIATNNLRERIKAIDGSSFKSKKLYFTPHLERNKESLLAFFDRIQDEHGSEALEKAIKQAESTGKAFQLYFVYSDDFIDQYTTTIYQLLVDESDYLAFVSANEEERESGEGYDL